MESTFISHLMNSKAKMNAEGILPVKEDETIKNQVTKQLKILLSNLQDFRMNLRKLGLIWLMKLSVALILLLGLYYLYFI